MCGGLRINRVEVRPGRSIKYRTIIGERTGIWGLGTGMGAYNARTENLDKVWSKLKDNRAVVEVDTFQEAGVDLATGTGKILLAGLYDDIGDLVILTYPSRGSVEKIHHRMPAVVIDENAWLREGKLVTFEGDFHVTTPAILDRRRQFLQSLKS